MTEILLKDLIFLDCEASSLFKGSYPIEVGYCTLDLDVRSSLIKPLAHWTDWSAESQNIHNIPRQELMEKGRDAKEFALELADTLRGRGVVSDAVEFDGRWLMKLFADTDVVPEYFMVDYWEVVAACAKRSKIPYNTKETILGRISEVEWVYPHTHRAGDDALQMAASCRAMYDHEWFEELLKKRSSNHSAYSTSV